MEATLITIITKPFSLFMVALLFCLKTLFTVIHTWVELLKAMIHLHLNLFRVIMISIVALVLLPVRVFTALQRESMLEEYLHEMQIQLENLVWERKELQAQLLKVNKERKVLESMLAETEEENDKAYARIELLESELQVMMLQNIELKETLDRHWSFIGHDKVNNGKDSGIGDKYDMSYGIHSWRASFIESGTVIPGRMGHQNASHSEELKKTESPGSMQAEGLIHHLSPDMFSSGNLFLNRALEERKEVAISQSLFSAFLSLLVGMIIWEAEDPCMPLVVALFIVVGISLKSVVLFFSTIKNKPASDAVALLSFNCFILGTLTYPTLPRVARLFAPVYSSFP